MQPLPFHNGDRISHSSLCPEIIPDWQASELADQSAGINGGWGRDGKACNPP